ncbi:MAG: hypothetical protein GY754_11965, partial [bacterium]|nr:hypothetical protein [bacterium]
MIKKRIFVIFLLSILFSLNCDNNSTSQNKPESPYEYLYLAGTSPKQSEGILTIDPIILPGSEAGKNHLGWPVASKLNDEIIISYHLSNYHWGDSDNRKINNLMVAEENFRNNEISDSLDLEANLSITEDDGNFRIGFGNAIGKYKNKIVLLNRKGTFEYENGTWGKINNVKINNAAPGMGLGPNLEEYNNELFGFGFRDEGKINYGNAAVGNSYSLVTDYNNDGLNDIIHFWNYKGKLAVTVIGCDGNGIYTQLCTNYSSEDGITTYLGGYDVDRSKFIPAKINNDDYMDIIHLWDNNGKLGVVSLISNGLKGFSIGWSNSGGNGVDLGGYDGDRSKFISAKLNNDDYTDIIHLWDNNGKLGMVEI